MFAPLITTMATPGLAIPLKAASRYVMRLLALPCLLSLLVPVSQSFAEDLPVNIAYVKQTGLTSSASLALFKTPENNGVAGALLGTDDSNTTGRFLKHRYALTVLEDANGEALTGKVQAWLKANSGPLILDVPDSTLQAILALPGADAGLMLNATNKSDSWRLNQCRAGLLHTSPSYAMLGDALGQFLMAKRWREWFLVSGSGEGDKAMAQAFERASKRFGTKITGHKTWTFDTDLRRTSQQEVPVLTQGEDYDVVLVADTQNLFGFYLPYNTWLPRPVAGTHGLKAASWHRSIEQWGAIQLQNRFFEANQRPMNDDDFNAWLAVRAVAEAVTRTKSNNSATLYQYLMSDKFELAAFKGRKLTFRQWNGQLRQPIPLVQPESLVSQSPQEGFLHPVTDLDTLGYDKPEVRCSMVKE